MAFSEKDNFLRVFAKFADIAVTPKDFEIDKVGQKSIKNKVLKEAICCLFEGLTRKIPAINFLRNVFTKVFSKLNIHNIERDFFSINVTTTDNHIDHLKQEESKE